MLLRLFFSVCLQLVEDVKAVGGPRPLRRPRKKEHPHHRLYLRPNQPGSLSRSEAKHGIVCDFIILFSWNNHEVCFHEIFYIIPCFVCISFVFLTAKWVRWWEKHLLFLLKTRENGRKKIHSVLENYFPHPYVWKWNFFGLFFFVIMLAHSLVFLLVPLLLLLYNFNAIDQWKKIVKF